MIYYLAKNKDKKNHVHFLLVLGDPFTKEKENRYKISKEGDISENELVEKSKLNDEEIISKEVFVEKVPAISGLIPTSTISAFPTPFEITVNGPVKEIIVKITRVAAPHAVLCSGFSPFFGWLFLKSIFVCCRFRVSGW